jgi:peptide deformylase
MRGWDAAGRPIAIQAEGLLAIVLQHEFDHLHGRLFIDRLSWLRRRRALRRLKALRARGSGLGRVSQ